MLHPDTPACSNECIRSIESTGPFQLPFIIYPACTLCVTLTHRAGTCWLHNSAPDEILPCGRRSAVAPPQAAGQADVAATWRRSAEPACRPTSWRIHRGVAHLQQASGANARACVGELNVVGGRARARAVSTLVTVHYVLVYVVQNRWDECHMPLLI